MRADASTRDERPFPGDPTAAIEQACAWRANDFRADDKPVDFLTKE
jgi:hypothetical protein